MKSKFQKLGINVDLFNFDPKYPQIVSSWPRNCGASETSATKPLYIAEPHTDVPKNRTKTNRLRLSALIEGKKWKLAFSSFFESRSASGWTYDSLKNLRQISPVVQSHLKQVCLSLSPPFLFGGDAKVRILCFFS